MSRRIAQQSIAIALISLTPWFAARADEGPAAPRVADGSQTSATAYEDYSARGGYEPEPPPRYDSQPGTAELWTPRFWFNASYLMWFAKSQPVPTLATDGTSIVLGNNSVTGRNVSGLRLELGAWLNQQSTIGVEGGFFSYYEGRTNRGITSGGSRLERPYIDTATGTPAALIIAAPGISTGSITAETTGSLVGGEINLVSRAFADPVDSVDFLLGFRNVNLVERLTITSVSDVTTGTASFLGTTYPAPSTLVATDEFFTGNYFYGAQVGARFQTGHGNLRFSGFGKVGLGGMQQLNRISGGSNLGIAAIDPGLVIYNGGLLANRDNRGRTLHTVFAVVPEVGLNLGYQVTEGVLFNVGYSTLYLSDVLRPGSQINSQVNSHTVATGASFSRNTAGETSTRLMDSTDYWVHGVNFTLLFRF